MDVFVARQPIFDTRTRVVGYELLHRAGAQNRYIGPDALTATRQLLAEQLLSDNWYRLTSGRPAWVNFPGELILDGSVTLVPPERMVVELLESIVVDDVVVSACEDLEDRGYILAADDVSDPEDANPLLDIVEIIKVDFRSANAAQRAALAERFAGRARLVAEKVETRAEQAEAIELGYDLLQGYFLREPAMVARRSLEQTRVGVLAALGAVSRDPMDFDEVEEAIKREMALTDKLLRYLNSAVFGWQGRVTSIRGALVALGEKQIRRWVSVVAVSTVAVDRPPELIASALIRARMCEQIAVAHSVHVPHLDLFLTGLYSQMHLLMDMDLETTMAEAPVPDIVRRALLGRSGPLWNALELVVAWETGDWDGVAAAAEALDLPLDALPTWYAEALEFADALRSADHSAGQANGHPEYVPAGASSPAHAVR
jgi:EAL and modified HD-GYP domain-containing signal transduction protein